MPVRDETDQIDHTRKPSTVAVAEEVGMAMTIGLLNRADDVGGVREADAVNAGYSTRCWMMDALRMMFGVGVTGEPDSVTAAGNPPPQDFIRSSFIIPRNNPHPPLHPRSGNLQQNCCMPSMPHDGSAPLYSADNAGCWAQVPSHGFPGHGNCSALESYQP